MRYKNLKVYKKWLNYLSIISIVSSNCSTVVLNLILVKAIIEKWIHGIVCAPKAYKNWWCGYYIYYFAKTSFI